VFSYIHSLVPAGPGWVNEGSNKEASIVDLRYKMKDVLEALEKREAIQILYYGRVKGTIVPVSSSQKTKVSSHPFFGMKKGEQIVIRKPR
jgi:hypothetical protein